MARKTCLIVSELTGSIAIEELKEIDGGFSYKGGKDANGLATSAEFIKNEDNTYHGVAKIGNETGDISDFKIIDYNEPLHDGYTLEHTLQNNGKAGGMADALVEVATKDLGLEKLNSLEELKNSLLGRTDYAMKTNANEKTTTSERNEYDRIQKIFSNAEHKLNEIDNSTKEITGTAKAERVLGDVITGGSSNRFDTVASQIGIYNLMAKSEDKISYTEAREKYVDYTESMEHTSKYFDQLIKTNNQENALQVESDTQEKGMGVGKKIKLIGGNIGVGVALSAVAIVLMPALSGLGVVAAAVASIKSISIGLARNKAAVEKTREKFVKEKQTERAELKQLNAEKNLALNEFRVQANDTLASYEKAESNTEPRSASLLKIEADTKADKTFETLGRALGVKNPNTELGRSVLQERVNTVVEHNPKSKEWKDIKDKFDTLVSKQSVDPDRIETEAETDIESQEGEPRIILPNEVEANEAKENTEKDTKPKAENPLKELYSINDKLAKNREKTLNKEIKLSKLKVEVANETDPDKKAKLENTISKVNDDIKEFKEERIALENAKPELEEKVKTMNPQERKDTMLERLDVIKDKIAEKQDKLDVATEAYDNAQTEIDVETCERKVNAIKGDIVDLADERDEIKEDLAKLEELENAVEEQPEQNTQNQESPEQNSEPIDPKDKEIADLKAELALKNQEIADLKESYEARLSKLEEKIAELTGQPVEKNENGENKSLETVQEDKVDTTNDNLDKSDFDAKLDTIFGSEKPFSNTVGFGQALERTITESKKFEVTGSNTEIKANGENVGAIYSKDEQQVAKNYNIDKNETTYVFGDGTSIPVEGKTSGNDKMWKGGHSISESWQESPELGNFAKLIGSNVSDLGPESLMVYEVIHQAVGNENFELLTETGVNPELDPKAKETMVDILDVLLTVDFVDDGLDNALDTIAQELGMEVDSAEKEPDSVENHEDNQNDPELENYSNENIDFDNINYDAYDEINEDYLDNDYPDYVPDSASDLPAPDFGSDNNDFDDYF